MHVAFCLYSQVCNTNPAHAMKCTNISILSSMTCGVQTQWRMGTRLRRNKSTEQQTSHEKISEKLSCDNLTIQLDQDGAYNAVT